MVDRSKKMQRSESENTISKAAVSDDSSEGIDVKICVDCGTSRTPLWRSGPAGPKSLCNACGIKSRKKRTPSVRDISKVSVSVDDKRSKRSLSHSIPISKSVAALGNGVTRKRSNVEKLRRKMIGDEEEQAAFLLMALSCGTVYAY